MGDERLVLLTLKAADQIVADEWGCMTPALRSAVHSIREHTQAMGDRLGELARLGQEIEGDLGFGVELNVTPKTPINAPKEAQRQFVNEIGHEIEIRVRPDGDDAVIIEMIGPDSTAENIVTPLEARELFSTLGEALG